MTVPSFAYGATIGISASTTSTAYVAIGQATNISGPSLTADTIDVTYHSTDLPYRKFIRGLINGGDISFEGNLTFVDINSSSSGIVSRLQSTNVQNFQITLPTTVTIYVTGSGIVNSFGMTAPVDGALTYTAGMQVTGPITIAEAT